MTSGEWLAQPDAATTVRVQDGATVTTDGPFAETKEALGGYFMFEGDDLEAAIAVAAQVPATRFGGAVEIRPSSSTRRTGGELRKAISVEPARTIAGMSATMRLRPVSRGPRGVARRSQASGEAGPRVHLSRFHFDRLVSAPSRPSRCADRRSFAIHRSALHDHASREPLGLRGSSLLGARSPSCPGAGARSSCDPSSPS